MTVVPGVEMLSVEAQLANGPGLIHPVILHASNHAMLVDTGLPGQMDTILDAADQTGIAPESLTEILITHSDMDHIGSLSAFAAKFPGIRILAHEDEKPYIECDRPPIRLSQMENGLSTLQGELKVQMTKLCDNLRHGYKKLRAEVHRVVADGEVLPILGGLRILHTPGHTAGHICLYLERHKLLIAGDMFNAEQGRLLLSPPFTRSDPDAYLVSLEKLGSLELNAAICYHGGLVQGDVTRMIADLVQANPLKTA